MYISNMTHFLNEEGNITKEMNKEGRELASFLSLIIDTATKIHREPATTSKVRCFKKGCEGIIEVELPSKTNEIQWCCPKCHVDGRISGWQGTKWDNK
jgi:hypothetical protein